MMEKKPAHDPHTASELAMNGRPMVEQGKSRNRILLAGFAVLILGTGYFVENYYYLQILTFIGINTLLALGLNMLMGYAGQISLGHAAFYGIGAYGTAIMTVHWGISPWLALPAAMGAAMAVAYLVGIPTLKLSGYYLGMGTLGFGMIVAILFREWSSVTGGSSGFVGIPMLAASLAQCLYAPNLIPIFEFGGGTGCVFAGTKLFFPGLGICLCKFHYLPAHYRLPDRPGLKGHSRR